jgi:hypothetical protein
MRPISRRQFLSSASLATAGVAALARPGWPLDSWANSGGEEFVVVETATGKVRGIRDGDVSIFRGVPYAGRVSGDRRFRRPAPLESWTGVRDALRLGPPSIQPGRETPRADEMHGVGVEHGVQADNVSLTQHLVDAAGAAAADGRLPMALEEGAVVGEVCLEGLVAMRVEVEQVHLVALDHHPRVGGADAPGADHAHGLAPQQLAQEQRRQPALEAAGGQVVVGLDDAPRGREGERRRELGRGVRQHPGGIAHGYAPARSRCDVDVVVTDGVVAVGAAARRRERVEGGRAPGFG